MENTNKQNTNPRQVRKTRRGTTEIPKKQVKKGTSIGGKGLLIGIGIFFFIVVALLFIFFFYLTSNPNAAKSFGIQAATVKSVTFVFAALLFGSLFILFLVLGLIYLYRLLSKPTEKIKNLIGTIIIFILGILNIVLGWIVFYRVNSIKTGDIIKSTDVLIANVNFADEKGDTKYIPLFQNKYPLIAPIKVSFQFNKKVFDRVDYPRLIQKEGNINPKKFVLDCGNGQKLEYTSYQFPQDNWCLYLKKGKYIVKLKLIYSTANTDSKAYVFNDKEINITSALRFKSKIKVKNGEIIGGEIGDRIKIDLTQVPIDLKLKGNAIDIDFEGEGNFIKYKGLASYVYHSDGLYNVLFKIPERQSYPVYTFPLRIKYSDKPTCKIIKKNKNNKYSFLVNVNPYHSSIKRVYYKLENISDYSIVKKGIGKRFIVKLKNGNDYRLIWYVEASNRKKGSCSIDISLASKINYDIQVKIKDKNDKEFKLSGDNVYVHSIPQTYTINVFVKPNSEFLDKGFDIDGDGEIDIDDNNYILKIKNKEEKKITYIVKDEKGNIYKQDINFKIKLKPVEAILFVKPKKGEAPLKVKLDASASKVNTENDEIVYFNWYFGDGEKLTDTRQGVVEHVYKKPGTYKAKVTVITDKNYQDTYTQLIRVYKPINTARIEFPDNIAGQILVGEPLKIRLNTNGLIKTIEWDFGDGKTFTCSGRECASITHLYEKKGIYHIEAKVIYSDGSPSVTARKTVNVIQQ